MTYKSSRPQKRGSGGGMPPGGSNDGPPHDLILIDSAGLNSKQASDALFSVAEKVWQDTRVDPDQPELRVVLFWSTITDPLVRNVFNRIGRIQALTGDGGNGLPDMPEPLNIAGKLLRMASSNREFDFFMDNVAIFGGILPDRWEISSNFSSYSIRSVVFVPEDPVVLHHSFIDSARETHQKMIDGELPTFSAGQLIQRLDKLMKNGEQVVDAIKSNWQHEALKGPGRFPK